MTVSIEDRDVLTPQEAAKRLGIGKNTAYEMLAAGVIPHIRFGWKYLIPRTAFEEWLRTTRMQSPIAPPAPPLPGGGTRGRRVT